MQPSKLQIIILTTVSVGSVGLTLAASLLANISTNFTGISSLIAFAVFCAFSLLIMSAEAFIVYYGTNRILNAGLAERDKEHREKLNKDCAKAITQILEEQIGRNRISGRPRAAVYVPNENGELVCKFVHNIPNGAFDRNLIYGPAEPIVGSIYANYNKPSPADLEDMFQPSSQIFPMMDSDKVVRILNQEKVKTALYIPVSHQDNRNKNIAVIVFDSQKALLGSELQNPEVIDRIWDASQNIAIWLSMMS